MSELLPYVVNPEAVGDPNQTPIVRLWDAHQYLTSDQRVSSQERASIVAAGELMLAEVREQRDAATARAERAEAALRMIAAAGCSTFTRMSCRDDYSGRYPVAKYGADRWCDACIAQAGIDGDARLDSSETPPAACPTCGPTTLERHPRLPVLRCANCKEHLGSDAPERSDEEKATCKDCRGGDHQWCAPEGCGCDCWAYLKPLDSALPVDGETTNG